MRIALFGASGMIGSRILAEALSRGHDVTAIVRDPTKMTQSHQKLTAVAGNVLDPGSVSKLVAGHDAVISAYSPGMANPQGSVARAASSLIAGVAGAKVKRLLAVGGAGCLLVRPGIDLIDSGFLPEAWKAIAIDHREAKRVFEREGGQLEWTLLCPAAYIEPGVRTGKFRLGTDQLVTDAKGESRISAEDYAVAMLDEAEKPAHIRQSFTAAYCIGRTIVDVHRVGAQTDEVYIGLRQMRRRNRQRTPTTAVSCAGTERASASDQPLPATE